MNPPCPTKGSISPFLLTALLVLAGIGATLVTMLDPDPIVRHPGTLSTGDRTRVEQLVVDSSPERLSRNGQRRIELSTDELNLLAAFLLQSLPAGREVAVRINPATPVSRIDVSIPWGEGRLRTYLNLSAGLRIQGSTPELVSLHAGRLPVPGPLRDTIVQTMVELAGRQNIDADQLAELRDTIRSIEIMDDGIVLDLEWHLDALHQLRDRAQQALLGPDAGQRLLHYYRLVHEAGRQQPVPDELYSWLAALFSSAARRTREGADPREENRSALLALAVYVNNIDPRLLMTDVPRALLRQSGDVPPLSGHHDLSRHFLTSAALGATAGGTIADVLANSKELHDARYGSGFSASDMTANQAGTRLGSIAVSHADQAVMLQQRLSTAGSNDLFMPPITGQRDTLDEEAFRARFGHTGSPAYQQLLDTLEARIDALPLYQEQ